MMITKRTKYGLKAMFFLADKNEDHFFSIEEIATSEHIPKRFLENILIELKRHELLTSKKGAQGGYKLSMPADKIFVGQVVRVLDGLLEPQQCMNKNYPAVCDDCESIAQCTVRIVLANLFNTAELMLNNTSLKDVQKTRLNAGTQS